MSEEFNLLDEPWVACLMTSGENKLLSMSSVFRRANQIRRVAGDSAMQDYAVLRVLLAAYWATAKRDLANHGRGFDPAEWWGEQLQAAERPEFGISTLSYLEEYRSRFNLFDPKQPFMQVADLRTEKGAISPVGRIIPEAESDYFTMRAGSGAKSIAFPEAARWLIAIQAWDYSGIKSGAVGDPRVKGGKGYPIGAGWTGRTGGVVLHGKNLAQTLVLNTPAGMIFERKYNNDAPVWERSINTAAPRASAKDDKSPGIIADGPCDILTWQARRVRLHRKGNLVDGVLVSNGDKYELRNQFQDPMTAYRYSKNQSNRVETVFLPKGHSPKQSLWRGLKPLLAANGAEAGEKSEPTDMRPATLEWLAARENDDEIPDEAIVVVELVGVVYGNKDAVIVDSIHEETPLHLAVLAARGSSVADMIVSAAQTTMDVATMAGQLAGCLNEASGSDYAFVKAPADALLSVLQGPFREWLAQISPGIDAFQYRQIWLEKLRDAANEEASRQIKGAGPTALTGTFPDNKDKFVSAATALSIFRARLKKALGLDLPQAQNIENDDEETEEVN